MRLLATVRTVNSIEPIHGADRIVLAKIDGWQCVVNKDSLTPGDKCMYFEIDALIPCTDERISFLVNANRGIREYDGVKYARIKTIRLRGELSQGLALPVSLFPEVDLNAIQEDYSEVLGVIKYEIPETNGPGVIIGRSAGDFPIVIPKTDEPRIQNIYGKYNTQYNDIEFRPSMKLDGSSHTLAVLYGNQRLQKLLDNPEYPFNFINEEEPEKSFQIVTCSRNNTLRYGAAENSHFWDATILMGWMEKLKEAGYPNIALQSECMGPGIQRNREGLNTLQLFCFRIWDIANQRFYSDAEFQEFCSEYNIQQVPQYPVMKPFVVYDNIDAMLKASEIGSITHKNAEGIVYKSTTEVQGSTLHFKVINNKYLLDDEE